MDEKDMNAEAFPPNDNYGGGKFIRKIDVCVDGNVVKARLEDDAHAFAVKFENIDGLIANVTGRAIRFPLTTCPAAFNRLKDLEGKSVEDDLNSLTKGSSPSTQCTQILELLLLGVEAIQKSEEYVSYLVEVDDEVDGAQAMMLHKNDQVVFEWVSKDFAVVSPEMIQGQSLFSGTGRWVSEIYGPEYSMMGKLMQRGIFVAQSRKLSLGKVAGSPAITHTPLLNTCFSYSEPQVDKAFRISSTYHDFTERPNEMLDFSI